MDDGDAIGLLGIELHTRGSTKTACIVYSELEFSVLQICCDLRLPGRAR